jgi:integrase
MGVDDCPPEFDIVVPLDEQAGALDAGRGRSHGYDHPERRLEAIGQSASPCLLPFFLFSLDAGLRPSETRSLRQSDLNLTWLDGNISQGEVIVPKSKTDAGEGRAIPLTARLRASLSLWLARFPNRESAHTMCSRIITPDSN